MVRKPRAFRQYWKIWVIGSMVERVPDKNEVEGPIPSSPTKSKLLGKINTSEQLAQVIFEIKFWSEQLKNKPEEICGFDNQDVTVRRVPFC